MKKAFEMWICLRTTAFGCALLVSLMHFGGSTLADMRAPGVGTLKSVGTMRDLSDASISLQAGSRNDVNDRLKAVIRQALEQRGYTVTSGGGAYTLSYDVEQSALTATQPPNTDETATEIGAGDAEMEGLPNTPGDFGFGERSEYIEPLEPQLAIPLADESSDPRQRSPYDLWFVLSNSNGQPVWQGAITAELPTQDPFAVAEAMVQPLVAHIGQAANGKQVPLE